MIVLRPSDVDESYTFVEHVASRVLDRFEYKIEIIQHFPPVVEIREGVGLFDVERDAKNVRGPGDETGFLLQTRMPPVTALRPTRSTAIRRAPQSIMPSRSAKFYSGWSRRASRPGQHQDKRLRPRQDGYQSC